MQQNQQSKKFVCQYNYLGKKWVLHIDAANHADAEERAKRLGTLEVLGELGGEVDAGILGASWMVRLKVWLLNFLPNVQAHPRRELKPEFKKDVTRRWMERLVRFSSFVGRCVLMGIVTLIFVLLVSGIAGIAIGLLEAVLGIP